MDDLVISERCVIPMTELSFVASRASGPGGQHVNKTSTRITLRWRPGDSAAFGGPDASLHGRVLSRLAPRLDGEGVLAISVDESRSQLRNRQIACERLVALVEAAMAVRRVRKASRPSRGAVERRLESKKRRSEIKAGRGRPDG